MRTKRSGTEQAELILKLYELRRESVMREARSVQQKTVDDLLAIVNKGGKQTGFDLQVYGYWDMVCAFVLHGMLTEELCMTPARRCNFQYSKIQPYLQGFRQKMNLAEWMQNIAKVVESSPRGRKRIAAMQKSGTGVAARSEKNSSVGKREERR